jgi:hypothetical protein
MIKITAYHETNGTRSELIPHEQIITDSNQLNAVRMLLMQSNGNHRIDLVYHEIPDEQPEPEPTIKVRVKDQTGVIERNSINIRNFINSLKHGKSIF